MSAFITTKWMPYFESHDPEYPSGFMKNLEVFDSEEEVNDYVAYLNENVIKKISGNYVGKEVSVYDTTNSVK